MTQKDLAPGVCSTGDRGSSSKAGSDGPTPTGANSPAYYWLHVDRVGVEHRFGSEPEVPSVFVRRFGGDEITLTYRRFIWGWDDKIKNMFIPPPRGGRWHLIDFDETSGVWQREARRP